MWRANLPWSVNIIPNPRLTRRIVVPILAQASTSLGFGLDQATKTDGPKEPTRIMRREVADSQRGVPNKGRASLRAQRCLVAFVDLLEKQMCSAGSLSRRGAAGGSRTSVTQRERTFRFMHLCSKFVSR